jgi:hypothetical protein
LHAFAENECLAPQFKQRFGRKYKMNKPRQLRRPNAAKAAC